MHIPKHYIKYLYLLVYLSINTSTYTKIICLYISVLVYVCDYVHLHMRRCACTRPCVCGYVCLCMRVYVCTDNS